MAEIRDVLPDINGTLVRETDSLGKVLAAGKLGGGSFQTVSWSFRKQKRKEGCPIWLHRVVISKTLDGARKGKDLALPSEEDPGSSFSSRDMEMIVVDANGKETSRFKASFGLVRALKAGTPADKPPIAAELWFSTTAFDARKTNVATMEELCKPASGE